MVTTVTAIFPNRKTIEADPAPVRKPLSIILAYMAWYSSCITKDPVNMLIARNNGDVIGFIIRPLSTDAALFALRA